MAKLKTTSVFTPGTFPVHSYVERKDKELETELRDALNTPGQVVSLSGPSKSGKTVLVERVVGRDLVITVTGATVKSPEDVWAKVLDWKGSPSQETKTLAGQVEISGSTSATVKAGLPFVVEGKGTVGGGGKVGTTYSSASVDSRRGMAQVVEELAHKDTVILLDDFHYMSREIQIEVAKQIKEAVRQGVKICTASVPHRSDDVVRSNPELRGRVRAIDLTYWSKDELLQIAILGFSALGVGIDFETLEIAAVEAAGSPQLMQLICLQFCLDLGIREGVVGTAQYELGEDARRRVFEKASANTDYRSLVKMLEGGPKTRGIDRKTFVFKDGTSGDVYRTILRAISSNPPSLSFNYDQLRERTGRECTGDGPSGSSISGSCVQMKKISDDLDREHAIDWDEEKEVFDIIDPYFLYYLRWSRLLTKAQ
ncbi:hypothetical protein HPP05_24595 [Corallococcus exiguus]|uniref:hypothetical protein n=1 Tax=Corallococcus exiguus TaxID=83462 RepID=UPI001494584F|nr:hypothetical protein [Corallococcus exiguus]NPC72929.1 hypothetical protein [Corallococcus exiguus]